MARSVDEIKQQLENLWMQNTVLRSLYGWELDHNGNPPQFLSLYSNASIENIILYIVSYCAYVIEVLFDEVKSEIETEITNQVPGSLQWYVKKLKEFRYNYTINDLGEYNNNNISEVELQNALVVKHAVALEDTVTGSLVLKVAGDNNGERAPLPPIQQTALEDYIMRIKYAGVRTQLINQEGNTFNCTVDIWYDPLLLPSDVITNCRAVIDNYIKNLPFNGEYSNMALTDKLQAVEGVKVVELTESSYIDNGEEKSIVAKVRPYAGYFNVGDIKINTYEYEH